MALDCQFSKVKVEHGLPWFVLIGLLVHLCGSVLVRLSANVQAVTVAFQITAIKPTE